MLCFIISSEYEVSNAVSSCGAPGMMEGGDNWKVSAPAQTGAGCPHVTFGLACAGLEGQLLQQLCLGSELSLGGL